MINYKNTLNLPYTKFSMRANLVSNELDILKCWHDDGLYELIRYAKKHKKKFYLHDGPPYANGDIHLGHAVNKILKDIILKFKSLMGYDAPYIPGWDCHGLPIELQVEKLFTESKHVNSSKFSYMCRSYALSQVEKQKKDFVRLGVIGNWHDAYLTMNFNTEANIIRVLGRLVANDYLYRGCKPVYWCLHCRSVLAEAEVEYSYHFSPSIYLTFQAVNSYEITSKFGIADSKMPISLIIWNTTPWTLPANRAIAVHPDFDYQLIETDIGRFVIADFVTQKIMSNMNIVNWKVLSIIKGYNLEFFRFKHPFMNFDVPIILGKYIKLNVGTGIVHVAPAHGIDDYIIGQKYNLEVSDLITPNGCYITNILPVLDGVQVFKANDIIIDLLSKANSLLYSTVLRHSYPYCWRHKLPVIFRTTYQWFLSMQTNNLRALMLEEVKKVRWIPIREFKRIYNMVYSRPDWCISRQRIWGVPIPFFIHKKTHVLHPRTIELIEIIAKRVEKFGIQTWWDLDPTEIIGNDAINYDKTSDVLDVWFDSGSTSISVFSVFSNFYDTKIDLYLEGADQYRGWFMSSLIISTAVTGIAPYKQVLTHGFTVDAQGYKMSKSLDNIISPKKIVNTLGADILRLWVSSTDYSNDMSISDKILDHVVDMYRRIRNTARFFLSNLNDFNPENHIISSDKMVILDRWAIGKAHDVQKDIIQFYDNYDFHLVLQRIMYFCSIEMGSFYLNVIKDRQYTTKKNSIARRSCQTAFYHIMEAMVRWISPIISFTADEIWHFLPGKRAKYVFTEEWYNGLFILNKTHVMNNVYWDTLLKVRNKVNKIISQACHDGYVGSSLESNITLYADSDLASKLRMLEDELKFFLLTSYVTVQDCSDNSIFSTQQEDSLNLKIVLKKAQGQKCSRCWHYVNYSQYREDLELCNRCLLNVFQDGEERKFV